MSEENTETAETERKSKRKRLVKDVSDLKITITEVETGVEVAVNAEELSEEIQKKLLMHGLSQKLGDSAAGKTGEDAINAIQETAKSLNEGTWTSRVASTGGAGKAISAAKLKKSLSGLSDAEKEASMAVLKKLGVDTSKF